MMSMDEPNYRDLELEIAAQAANDVFGQGAIGFITGRSNPYPPGQIPQHALWQEGFRAERRARFQAATKKWRRK